jgi:hypothetical protein
MLRCATPKSHIKTPHQRSKIHLFQDPEKLTTAESSGRRRQVITLAFPFAISSPAFIFSVFSFWNQQATFLARAPAGLCHPRGTLVVVGLRPTLL